MSIEITSKNITKFNKRLHQAIQAFQAANKPFSLSSSAELFSQALGFKTYHDLQLHLEQSPSLNPTISSPIAAVGALHQIQIGQLTQQCFSTDLLELAMPWLNSLEALIVTHQTQAEHTRIMEWRWVRLHSGMTLEAIFDTGTDFVHFGLNPSAQQRHCKDNLLCSSDLELFKKITNHLELLFAMPIERHEWDRVIHSEFLHNSTHHFYCLHRQDPSAIPFEASGYLRRTYLVLDSNKVVLPSPSQALWDVYDLKTIKDLSLMEVKSLTELRDELLYHSNLPMGADFIVLECLTPIDPLQSSPYLICTHYGKTHYEGREYFIHMHGTHGEKMPSTFGEFNLDKDNLHFIPALIQGYLAGTLYHKNAPYGINEEAFQYWKRGYHMGSEGRFIRSPSMKKKPAPSSLLG